MSQLFLFELSVFVLVVIVSEKKPYDLKLNYSFLIRVSSERYANIFMYATLPISQKA